MSLNSEILSSLRGIQRVSAIAADVKSLPYAQRQKTLQAYLLALPRREAIRLDYLWPLYARDSQLPPDGDWGHLAHTSRARLRQDTHRSRVDSLSG